MCMKGIVENMNNIGQWSDIEKWTGHITHGLAATKTLIVSMEMIEC
jgi:hypothetical protein